MKKIYSLFVFALIGSALVTAQTSGTLGKGFNFIAPDSTFSLKLGIRIQPLLSINYRDFETFTDPSLDELQMTLRRGRIKFDGWVHNPNVVYKLELALGSRNLGGADQYTSFANRMVLDAVVKWQFAPGYYVWFGQTKLPGNRERVVSSQKLQFVDRSIVNGRFNIDRDIGFQLHIIKKHANNPLNLAFAISMGDGRNISTFNAGGLEYTGRVEYLPFGSFKNKGDYFQSDLEREETLKASLGVTFDFNHDAVRQRGNMGAYVLDSNGNFVTQPLSTWFVDLCVKYQGWSWETEFADKSAPMPVYFENGNRINAFYTGWGINTQTAYLLKSNWEFGIRYSFVEPDKDVDVKLGNQTQYTAVLSKYVVGHSLKIQSDISYSTYQFEDTEWQFRLQVEVAL